MLVIDEASMVGTRLLERVTQEAERYGAKIVLVGDEQQLQAIEAGSPFESLINRLGCVRMEGIQRQRDPWARKASSGLSLRAEVVEALEEYTENAAWCTWRKKQSSSPGSTCRRLGGGRANLWFESDLGADWNSSRGAPGERPHPASSVSCSVALGMTVHRETKPECSSLVIGFGA